MKLVKLSLENIDWLKEIEKSPNKALDQLRNGLHKPNEPLSDDKFENVCMRLSKIESFLEQNSGGQFV